MYKIETNPELASRLKGHLMLVHDVIMPGQRHGFGDMNEWFFWKMADHYARWLIGDREDRPIDIEQMNND